ncbi:hypothetical protein AWN88_14145 [Agrobacterium tumefaciens]|nr:hypothetical protein AWN88_14145 [Agrobacterium tumefaciens]KAJ34024.1 hypothetical protein BW45_06280 [Agrobacterium tumefaciens]
MSARYFHHMTRRAMKLIHEPGSHRWIRFDGPSSGHSVTLIFNPAQIIVDADGIAMSAPAPFAWIKLSDIVAIAPARADHTDRAINNDDRLVIAGERYRPESCRLHSHDLLEVELFKER